MSASLGGGHEPEPLEDTAQELSFSRAGRQGALPATPSGIWQLAWPAMTTYGLHSLVGFVDFLIVGRLGSDAVAAVGVAVQIHFFVFGLLAAVTTGTVAVVAREWGSGDREEASRATLVAVVLCSLVATLSMGAIPFSESLVSLLGVRPEVADVGGRCLAILLAFNIPFAIGLAITTALRGAGDVKTPLFVGLFTNALNVVGDYALVFGRWGAPELGAEGSAIASGLSFLAGGVMLAVLWRREKLVLLGRIALASFDLPRAWRQLRIGLPTALEQAAWQGGVLLFLGIVASYGTESITAYLIGVRILSLCFVPGLGFATAAATLVGQHLGADEPEQAARAGWRANAGAMVVMGSVGLAIVLSASFLAGLFGAVGEQTTQLTIVFIHILGAAQPLMAIEFALGGALRGAGDTRFPLYAILTGLFVFRLGAAVFIAGPLFGTITAIWSCLLADYTVKALLLLLRFRSGRWRLARV